MRLRLSTRGRSYRAFGYRVSEVPVEWYSRERRNRPTMEAQNALIRRNLDELANRIEADGQEIHGVLVEVASIKAQVGHLLDRMDARDDDLDELISSFKFSRRLRQWLWGAVAGGALLLAGLLDTLHVFESIGRNPPQ